jgi:hypothetical protein
MNREQMIAWLTLEGWELYEYFDKSRGLWYRSIKRGVERIGQGGSYFNPTSWGRDAQRTEWFRIQDSTVKVFYEKASLL